MKTFKFYDDIVMTSKQINEIYNRDMCNSLSNLNNKIIIKGYELSEFRKKYKNYINPKTSKFRLYPFLALKELIEKVETTEKQKKKIYKYFKKNKVENQKIEAEQLPLFEITKEEDKTDKKIINVLISMFTNAKSEEIQRELIPYIFDNIGIEMKKTNQGDNY